MPALPDPTHLRKVALFRGLGLSQLATLNKLMRRQLLPAGARWVMSDQLDDTMYVIHTGIVKVAVEQADGAELILVILGPGDVLGAATIGDCLGGARSVIALEETSLFWVDREAFDNCVQVMPDLSTNLLAVLSRRVRMANERIEAMAGMDVRSRIVRHLLLLAREYGQPEDEPASGRVRIPLRLTQGDLARLVGASRVRVNHALSELRRRELIERNGDSHFWIQDVAGLEKLR